VATRLTISASELGLTLAQAAENEPLAQEISVTTRRDGVHLWLLTQRATDEDERRLFGLLEPVDARFPDAAFQLHILNPASYTVDLHSVLPKDAEKIFSRAA
jgi:hypothetical protein